MGVRLPAEYQEVLFIIGQGKQYIDTGYVLNSECRVQGRYDLYELKGVLALFGSRNDQYNNAFAIFNVSAAPRVDYGNTLKTYSFSYAGGNDRNVLEFDLNAGIATVNGNTYAFADSLKPFTCPSTAMIFAAHTGDTIDTRCPKGEIVYLKITDENGIVVRDMVPCYRKSDNKPGMYDLVTGTFFVNQGTGEFTVGPDVIDSISPLMVAWRRMLMRQKPARLPAEYQEVEYIQGRITTNPAYIDTLYVPTINTKLRVKFSPNNKNSNGYFGARRDPYRFYCATFNDGTRVSCGMTVNTWPATRIAITYGSIYDATMENGKSSINGTTITTPGISESQWSDTIGTIQLWSLAQSAWVTPNAEAKYYLCQIWENNVLVRDFVPCYRKSDNEVGMYDLIGMRFYTNAGVGSLAAGPDVN